MDTPNGWRLQTIDISFCANCKEHIQKQLAESVILRSCIIGRTGTCDLTLVNLTQHRLMQTNTSVSAYKAQKVGPYGTLLKLTNDGRRILLKDIKTS